MPRPAPRRTAIATLAATAAASAAVAAALTAAPAGAATTAPVTVSKRTLSVDVAVGPDGGTHCRIVADLYTPSTATADHPAPAILTTNGFGGSKDDQAGVGQEFGERGYVVLSYSGLGFGGSGCKIYLDDPDYDGKAASQLVDYLAGTRADTDGQRLDMVALDGPGDPRVGMIGGSYGGQVQLAAASVDPRIDALIPLITWNDLAYSLAPNNTDLARGVTYRTPGVYKREWTNLFFGLGVADGVTGASADPTRDVGCPNFTDAACEAKAELDALGYPTDSTLAFSRHASVTSYVSRVHAPTLLVQGQNDTLFNLQEAVATYTALRAQGTPVRMIWQSWGHSGGTPAPGELDLTGTRDLTTTYLGRRFLAWFDHWLKGDKAAPLGPGFAWFEDWVAYDGSAPAGAEPAYGTAKAYPVGTTQDWYLSGDGTLTTAAGDVVPGAQSWANAAGAPTSYSETSALEGSTVNNPPYDAPGTFASWTSAPLPADLVTVGVPTLDVRLDAPSAALTQDADPAGKLVLFAKIYDVAPDGTQTLQHRLISPVRVADVTKPVHIELPGVAELWTAGHRLRLVLAASDAAYAGNSTVVPVTLRTDPAAPPVLHLPVLASQ